MLYKQIDKFIVYELINLNEKQNREYLYLENKLIEVLGICISKEIKNILFITYPKRLYNILFRMLKKRGKALLLCGESCLSFLQGGK